METKGYIFGTRVYKFISFIAIVVLLLLFKAYLATIIYYNSKKVNDLLQEKSVLSAENDTLKQEIEALKFKTQVTDAIIKSSLKINEADIKHDN